MRTRSLAVALFATMSDRPDGLWHGDHARAIGGRRAQDRPRDRRRHARRQVVQRGVVEGHPGRRRPRSAATATNIVTKTPADYATNIQTFVDQKYDIIVTVGFALGDATIKAASANPTIKFIGVDQFICVPKDAE